MRLPVEKSRTRLTIRKLLKKALNRGAMTAPEVPSIISSLKQRLSGRSPFELYPEASALRMANLLQHFPPEWFAGKKVLEVGCGEGDSGQVLVGLGSRVVSCDGRPSNISRLRQKYPDREAFVLDLDKEQIPTGYDAVLCFGVLYHLSNPSWFLRQLKSPVLFLESIVTDSRLSVCPFVREAGIGQALNRWGCRPSPRWIIEHLPEYRLMDISTSTANRDAFVYDWLPHDDGRWERNGNFLRKMWIGHRVTEP